MCGNERYGALGAALVALGATVMPSSAGAASAPAAFYDFCQQNPDECARQGGGEVSLTSARLDELRRVNASVNTSIRPATDAQSRGTSDTWSLLNPGDAGDCEDYAILKRHELIARGWPSSSLLLTVVRDPHGEGHAVLTVSTSQGELVLDNKTSAIRAPQNTPYTYYSRQSSEDPMRWVAVGYNARRAVETATVSYSASAVAAPSVGAARYVATTQEENSAAATLKWWRGARGLR
jgi:predicted transglutaminase-like cysteine proteinase